MGETKDPATSIAGSFVHFPDKWNRWSPVHRRVGA
jgi:hypothetical protein